MYHPKRMRKEVILAILLGSLLGLAIAFGVWRANLALSPQLPKTTTSSPAPNKGEEVISNLIVTQPEDNELVKTEKITVAGKTTPKLTVVITTPVDEVVVEADQSGNFSADVKLESGANTILVTTVDEGGQTQEQELTVTYSTEFKEE